MTEEQASYRQIIKATSLFGGVQAVQIIIQVIRSKFIAVLLGTSGIGIIGLLTSTIGLISSMTNFGLGISAVKTIAAAYETKDEKRIATIVIVLRRLIWTTGSIGAIITIIFSPMLSSLAFGNREYTIAFIWISCTLLFNQLTNGQLAVLQGLRKLHYLAKSNLYGSILGLIITIPLYYKLGIDGIVPGIIIASLISLLFSWLYARKVSISAIKVSPSNIISEGKEMLIMGFMISLSGLIALGASYIIRVHISRIGGLDQVGLYNAGFAIIHTYVGLIFTAMGTDYYPRLSAVAHSNELSTQNINQQAEVSLLILAPILIVFIIFINWVIILLYSSAFIEVNSMIIWAALGMFFKASAWAIGFIFLAKGTSKLFLWNELIANLYLLGLNLLGYNYMGLTGLGLSFLVAYFLYSIQVYLVARWKFKFVFGMAYYKIFALQFGLAVISFLAMKILSSPLDYVMGTGLILISLWYSFIELDKRMDLKSLLIRFKNK